MCKCNTKVSVDQECSCNVCEKKSGNTVGGSIVCGIIGGLLGGPVGAAVGAAVGAGLGACADDADYKKCKEG